MNLLRFAILGFAALVVAACLPVTTKHPIGTTVGFKEDKALLGMWKGRGEDEDAKDAWFAFLRNADGSTTAIMMTSDPDGDDWGTFRLDLATLGGNRIMNVHGGLKNGKPDDDEMSKQNIPFLYSFGADGTLTLSLLDEKAVAAAIQAGKIAGTVEKSSMGDVTITAEPAALDAFFATKEGAALFSSKLVTLKRVN
ncbi:MAG TPA: hypothetical protein VG889_22610 [Rhizomicrobium sp.]|nr:hypothetical protein [Rhizomicrobium sp.]